jgi:hypothetical protein
MLRKLQCYVTYTVHCCVMCVCISVSYAGLGVTKFRPKYAWKSRWSFAHTEAGVPRTQAAIEGKNPDLAKRGGMNRREEVTAFLPHMAKFITSESTSMIRQPSKQFKHVPTIDNQDWRGAQKILQGLRKLCFITAPTRNNSQYAWPAGLILMPSDGLFNKLCERFEIDNNTTGRKAQERAFERICEKLNQEAFAFMQLAYATEEKAATWNYDLSWVLCALKKFYVLTENVRENGEYLWYSCTCPRFRMKAKCKHVIAYGVAQECFTVPQDKSLVKIGRKPKPGRPKKVKKTHPWHKLDSDNEATDTDEDE